MKKTARRRLSRVFCMFRGGAELYVVREAGLPIYHSKAITQGYASSSSVTSYSLGAPSEYDSSSAS